MKRLFYIIPFCLVLLTGGLIALAPASCHALTDVEQSLRNADPTTAGGYADNTKGFTSILDKVLNTSLIFIGGLAFLSLLYAGFIYISAFGDATKMEMAKKQITWTIIGIVAISLSLIIVKAVVKVSTSNQQLNSINQLE